MKDQTLFDKMYAGWMGKNIGGTLGGPLEGRMELMDIKGYTQEIVGALENDDLDLQLINLHCVEQYGGRADVSLLSKEWLAHVHFPFDEYGHALTNMRRGTGAPLSGCYNNFFVDCMGSPIRSEIWAMLCAGMPDLAAFYAYHDASVDHAGGEGVYGEIFFAVLESLAFVEKDTFKLIDAALSYLPKHCDVYKAVTHLLECYHGGMGWVDARQSLIDQFGTDNFTMAPINIAFTLVGWLYEEGFTKQMLTTLNCGYDTDCTVATLGSLLGILHGPDYLDSYWTDPLGEDVVVSKPINGFDPPKTITELTERTIAARTLVQEHYAQQPDKSVFKIPYQDYVEVYQLPEGSHKKHDRTVEVTYEGDSPAFRPGQTKQVFVKVVNHQSLPITFAVCADVPGFDAGAPATLALGEGETGECSLTLTAPVTKSAFYRGKIELKIYLDGLYWMSEFVPLTLVPTMDWRVCIDGEQQDVFCETNVIAVDGLAKKDGDIKTFTASTIIRAPEAGKACIKFACRNPLRATLNGKLLFDCKEETIVIPAYHRADPKKCADVELNAGDNVLEVEVGDPGSLTELYFMIVDRGYYWAYQLDKVFA